MYNPETYGFYDAYLERFQAEARWPMKLKRVAVRVPADIGAAIKDFAAEAGGGLVVMVDAFNVINQATIRRALQDYPLPHIVPWRSLRPNGNPKCSSSRTTSAALRHMYSIASRSPS